MFSLFSLFFGWVVAIVLLCHDASFPICIAHESPVGWPSPLLFLKQLQNAALVLQALPAETDKTGVLVT